LLTAGYVFDLKKDFKLKPSILLKYLKNAPLEADFNLLMAHIVVRAFMRHHCDIINELLYLVMVETRNKS
jgi:hypothetical protein